MLRYRSSSTYNQLLIAHILISILMSTIFIKYLPPGRPILDWSQNWKCSEFIEIWHIWYFEYPNLGFDVKVIFIKYLSPVWHKLVPKLEVLRIYWNLAQSIFQICQSWFCCQKYFSLLNIYQLLGPNWSQNEKYSEFIEIWLNWYFQYANLNFDVQMIFIEYLPSARPKLVQN